MVAKLPDASSKWFYEPKLDGYRAIAVGNGSQWSLYSMEGQSFNDRFAGIAAARPLHPPSLEITVWRFVKRSTESPDEVCFGGLGKTS